MDLNTLKQAAKAKLQGCCRVCRVCNGLSCAGEMPGMGGRGTGATFHNNIEALAGYRLKMHTVHTIHHPDLSCRILGMDLASPILVAPIAGVGVNLNKALTEEEYASAVVRGAIKAGTIAMTGDGSFSEQFECGLAALKAAGGLGIPVIKPRSTDKVIALAHRAAAAGAPAFGMDIDAAGFIDMAKSGQPVGPKTREELAEIKAKTSIPFIVKGILCPEDAESCLEAGVDAIVVSNHGGRALDHLPGAAEILPLIAQAVGSKMTILVDGGIRSGTDVLKMLALGADAVLVGRPLAIAAVGGGAEGVELVLRKLADELLSAMVLTGTASVAAVPRTILF